MTTSTRSETAAGRAGSTASTRPDVRAARRSQVASVGLVLVLLAVSVFAVVEAQLTAAAAEEAVAASSVSEDYGRAATAVAAEESLERKYRLEPGEAVRVRFDQSAAALIAALGEVQRDGDVSDRALVYEVTQQHGVYLEAIGRLFAAIDRGDIDAALRIDADETDPVFGVMEAAVLDAAAGKHERALVALQELESVTRVLTPVVFLAGLLLAGLLASITPGSPAPPDRTITRAVLARDQPAVAGLVGPPELALRGAICSTKARICRGVGGRPGCRRG